MGRFWQGPLYPSDGEELVDMVAYCHRPDTRDWSIALLPGNYTIPENNPIIMSSPGGGIGAVRIFGLSGASFGEVGSQPRIISESLVQPPIIFQRDRGSVIENVEIVGPNSFASDFPTFFELLDDDMFLKAGVRDNRYSPQCAIAIDPITNGAPGGNDANMYPGLEHLYSTLPQRGTTSSGCKFRNVTLIGHNVGFGIALAGQVNCENMVFDSCQTNYCRVHYANGGHQARHNLIRGASGYGGQVFQDTSRYGGQIGAPMDIFGANVGAMQRVFSIVHGRGDLYVAAMYVESSHSLGVLGTGQALSQGNAIFDSLRFTALTPTNDEQEALAAMADAHLSNFMAVKFTGGNWAPRQPFSRRNLLRFFNRGPITFDNVEFVAYDGLSATGANNLPIAFHDVANVRMTDCRVADVNGAGYRTSRSITHSTSAIGSVEVTQISGAVGSFTLDGHGCSVGDVIYPASAVAGWLPKFPSGNTSYASAMAIGVVAAVDGDTVTLHNMPEGFAALLPLTLTVNRRTLAFG